MIRLRQLTTERLQEFFVARDSLRIAYSTVVSLRDKDPKDTEVAAICHLVFKRLTIVDTVLDDEDVTESMAKGALQGGQDALTEVHKLLRPQEAGT